MNNSTSTPPARSLVLLAFAIIYIVWGSTYLAIRVVVETIPPFLSAASRFLVAGAMLMGFLKLRGVALPNSSQWRHSLVSGLLLTVGGNGLVVWAEQSISSGLAALLVALTPVWFALLDWLRPGGKQPQAKTIVGIAIGFTGVILLVTGRSLPGSGGQQSSLWAASAVIVAGFLWAVGSLFSKYSPNHGSPWMNAAAQMICGGAGLSVVAFCTNELPRTEFSAISVHSWIAWLYLVLFGSWVGFTAYVWLLRVSTPARISTYAYVNPVIAVLLGWIVLDETITARMAWGALVVLAGVITITLPASILSDVKRRIARAFSVKSAGDAKACYTTE